MPSKTAQERKRIGRVVQTLSVRRYRQGDFRNCHDVKKLRSSLDDLVRMLNITLSLDTTHLVDLEKSRADPENGYVELTISRSLKIDIIEDLMVHYGVLRSHQEIFPRPRGRRALDY